MMKTGARPPVFKFSPGSPGEKRRLLGKGKGGWRDLGGQRAFRTPGREGIAAGMKGESARARGCREDRSCSQATTTVLGEGVLKGQQKPPGSHWGD